MRAALLLLVLLASTGAAQTMPEGATNPFGHVPIRVHLDFANLTAQDAGFADEARAALRYWEAGGNGRLAWAVTFQEVDDPAQADITFWFRDAGRAGPLCDEAEGVLGCARPFERPVPIEVVARRADDTFVPYRQVREVSEHEIGHALGFGHSAIPGDIMQPRASLAAETAWRPGDAWRLVAGGFVLLAVLAGIGWIGWRALRPKGEIGRVRRISLAEHDGPCPVERRGHAFRDADIEVDGRLEPWRVCVHCGGGIPVETLSSADALGGS